MSGIVVHPVVAERAAEVGAREGRPRAQEHVKLTARGRRVAVLVAVVLSGSVGLVGGRAVAVPEVEAPPVVQVVIAPGDTLWSLAQEVAQPGEDLRDVVRAIQRLNGMETVDLRAGDVVLVPDER